MAKVDKIETGEQKDLNILYLEGKPNAMRANCSTGAFTIGGDRRVPLGKTLKVHPLAFRVFFGSLFGMSDREWLEIFFLRGEEGKQHLASILLHQYSVDEFKSAHEYFFYEFTNSQGKPVGLVDLEFNLGFQKVVNSAGQEFFKIEILDVEQKEHSDEVKAWVDTQCIFNSNTMKGALKHSDIFNFENYRKVDGAIERRTVNTETGEEEWVPELVHLGLE